MRTLLKKQISILITEKAITFLDVMVFFCPDKSGRKGIARG